MMPENWYLWVSLMGCVLYAGQQIETLIGKRLDKIERELEALREGIGQVDIDLTRLWAINKATDDVG
ncbi:hypothetical protein JQ580_04725 [Bradyrhizobium japonicum]|uniref:hypothetical protein n=1 Tax=Bradyrhizobium japonicum TaxID=375 RepID=UPI001BA71280|nr:hypothetical protein [Bradyrhizobium japonicum]MBR0990019.1 hypothetical protein [Bradyrhizobium japonicum]